MFKTLLNLLVIGGATVFGALINFIVQLILVRNTTPEIYGNFSGLFYLVTTVSPLCGFGATQLILKTFGRYGEKGKIIVPYIIRFVFFSTLSVILILIIWFISSYKDNYMIWAGLLMTFIIIGQLTVELLISVYQIEENYIKLSVWSVLQPVIRFLILFLIIYLFNIDLTIMNMSLSFFVASLIIFLLGIKKNIDLYNGIITTKNKGGDELKITKKIKLREIAKEAAPFGLASTFYLIYFQMGIVFVKELVGSEQAAYYSVAFLIINAAMLLPIVVFNKYLIPKQHRWAYHNKERLHQVFIVGNLVMLIIGLLLMVILRELMPYIIPKVFGEEYYRAIPIMNVLLINIPVIFIASSVGSTLVTGNNMVKKVKYMGFVALLSALLSIFILPEYGVLGQAWISVGCNTILLMFYYYASKKYVFN